jgi:hypothetical protein
VSYRNKTCLVSDIAGYSTRSRAEQAVAQQRLLDVMTFACRHARIFRVPARNRQDRGDGRLYVLPSRADEALMIPRLIMGLRHGLYLANQGNRGAGRLRIRVAMARGQVALGPTGFLGQPPITACRLVDAPEAKAALATREDADLVVVVTDEMYEDVIKLEYPGVPSGDFTSALLMVKEYAGTAWLSVPSVGPVLPPDSANGQWAAALAAGAAAGVIVILGVGHGNHDDDGLEWNESWDGLPDGSAWDDPGDDGSGSDGTNIDDPDLGDPYHEDPDHHDLGDHGWDDPWDDASL